MGSPGKAAPTQLPAGVPPRIEIKGGAIRNRGGKTDSEGKKFIKDEVRKLSALRQHTLRWRTVWLPNLLLGFGLYSHMLPPSPLLGWHFPRRRRADSFVPHFPTSGLTLVCPGE